MPERLAIAYIRLQLGVAKALQREKIKDINLTLLTTRFVFAVKKLVYRQNTPFGGLHTRN